VTSNDESKTICMVAVSSWERLPSPNVPLHADAADPRDKLHS
jgi:hypothetical protein